MRRLSRKAAEAHIKAQRKEADALIDGLFSKLVEQREQLTGRPSPQEIAQRLHGVIKKLRQHVEADGPLNREEARWLLAFFLTREFWPEQIPALDAALEPCYDIMDEAMVSVDVTNRKIDAGLLREVWAKAQEIAARRNFQRLQAEARERLARKAGEQTQP